MAERFAGLQFDEIKKEISSFCSFSVGSQLILDAAPVFTRMAVELSLKRMKQALDITYKYGSMPFGGIYDISEYVSLAMKNGTLTPQQLLQVADQVYGVLNIRKFMAEVQSDKDQIMELVNTMQVNEGMATQIVKCISRSYEVNDNASVQLRNIRRQLKATQATIAAKMASFISRNRNYLQDDIIATRNDRSVVLVKNNYKNTVTGLQYGSSSSGQATYLEPSELIPYNNELQQLHDDEAREVQRILHSLSQEVKKEGNRLLANTETLGILDALFARAQWGKSHDAVVGEINDDMNLIIEKGRHPLIDSSKVVANSYHIEKPVRTILITGPNTGGKTVSLKVIGLFAVMQLSGMPLPCSYASIPVYDNIFYDIGDNQSIQDDLSTFSAHIKKLGWICNKATSHSLVILDELGSGTDPVEGQALASAVLDYFRQKQVYTVATTHYAKLKAYGQQHDDIMLSSVEFDQKNLKPTYRYLENTIGQSNALEIASRYGVKKEIIDAARQFKQEQQTPEDIVLEKLRSQLELASQQSDELEAQLRAVEAEKQSLLEKQQKLENERQAIIDKATQQASEIVLQAELESEDIIEQLKAQKNYQINEVAKLKHRLKEIAPQIEEEEEEEEDDDAPLKVGDYVKINITNQSGEIISMDKKNAVVLCGNARIKASLSNLVKTSRPKQKQVNLKPKVQKSSSFKMECNIIGMRVEEGLAVMDKFLDDALLANAPFVRIVHGVGTGALRKAVWDQLKKYKYVKRIEMAEASNGGAGATIVILKDS